MVSVLCRIGKTPKSVNFCLTPPKIFRTLTDVVKVVSVLKRLARDLLQETPGAINLMAREGSVEDLAHCYALYESFWFPSAEACWRVLPEMWHDLLSAGRMQLFLVEDRAKPPGSRIVSFSATIFATDEFCCQAQSTLPPGLGVQVAEHYLSHELPVLNREQVARANARGGLNVMMCFGGWEQDGLLPEQILAVREKQIEAFHLAHRGYRMKEFLAEPIGREALQWMLGAGARLRREYSRYLQKHRAPTKYSPRPRLVGLTKEEALGSPGSYLSSFFVYTPPRFHFNRSEQLLLHHALLGETSEELAASLFISPWTVKKRWHAIYERVADVDRELLLPPVANSPDATSRGAERRRHLLHYLRQHLEELRPLSR
jgi:DNA-binding CsgD family transcriptional regulator